MASIMTAVFNLALNLVPVLVFLLAFGLVTMGLGFVLVLPLWVAGDIPPWLADLEIDDVSGRRPPSALFVRRLRSIALGHTDGVARGLR